MKKLNNYLHTYRRRTALSQKDVARLLGSRAGARVSRYEHGRRIPELLTALAFEILLGAPLRELFAGLYDQVEEELRDRARELARREPTRHRLRKLRVLRSLGCLEPVEAPIHQDEDEAHQ